MTINFSKRTARLGFQITVPAGWRKSSRKVRIPTPEGYGLIRMVDVGLQEQKYLWKRDGTDLVLDAKDLASQRYLVEVEGRISKNSLDSIVYINPLTAKCGDEKCDRYMLEARIKDTEMLENTYRNLNVDEVNFGVSVDVYKVFALAVPPDAKAAGQSKPPAASSGRFGGDGRFGADAGRKQDNAAPPHDRGNFREIVHKVTGEDVVRDYVHATWPYDVGAISRPTKYADNLPQDIAVQALTRLTLRSPAAHGYLVFDRERYAERLRSEFKNL